MSIAEITGLVLSAAAAGAINAVAGGGTLVTFPTLLFFGTPPVIANATSTLALVVGTSGSLYGYRRHITPVKPWLRRFLPISILGGFIGGILLTYTSNKVFSKLVPFLILFATVLFFSQGIVRRFSTQQSGDRREQPAVWGAVLFQFVVAVYGGYFGAGIGILMLATFGFIGLENINEMNTLKTILGSLINLVATLWFVAAGLIHWPEAAVMTIGAMAGYYVGSHFAQRIEQKRVRQIITAVGFILSLVTFYEEFLR
jgi:uncharacterized membrane protein YfcA